MVCVQRTTSSALTIMTFVVTLISLCGCAEDISRNLVRDPVELGNPYPVSKGTYYMPVVKRKHPNHHRRPTSNIYTSSQAVSSASDEEHIISGSGKRPTGKNSHIPSHVSTESEENCPMCAAARQNAQLTSGIDEETLKALRVEIVKQQILKKLGLTEPPKLDNATKSHKAVLPSIALGNLMLSNDVRDADEDVSHLDLEDFYGKTEQIIVLSHEVIPNCAAWSSNSHSIAASCFNFKLPKEVRSNQISSAELWVYKFSDVPKSSEVTVQPHNFSVSEILSSSRSSRRRSSIHVNRITSREDVPDTAGWINFNVTERARMWLVTDAHEHTIRISCSTCSKDLNEFPFDSLGEQQPFIVFNIANGKRKKRSRRSINCSAGVTECCRESLYISFKDIGWDWVLEPPGFDAFYCKGKCHGDAALALTVTGHSGVMIDYVKNRGGLNNKTAELIPCCTATEMDPISMIYRDPDPSSYGTTLQKVELPNMVVKSCGCK